MVSFSATDVHLDNTCLFSDGQGLTIGKSETYQKWRAYKQKRTKK